jgi:hypothetical protein
MDFNDIGREGGGVKGHKVLSRPRQTALLSAEGKKAKPYESTF